MEVGSYQFATSGGWQVRHDVYMLTTAHNTPVDTAMKHPKGSHDKQPLPWPTCICDYNLFMGGVSLTDQYISYYSLTWRKTLKWWEKLFWRFIDICILNSWIIFWSSFPESKIQSHRLFRIELIAERISARLWIGDLFSQSMYVRTYVVGHAQECHAECRYIP